MMFFNHVALFVSVFIPMFFGATFDNIENAMVESLLNITNEDFERTVKAEIRGSRALKNDSILVHLLERAQVPEPVFKTESIDSCFSENQNANNNTIYSNNTICNISRPSAKRVFPRHISFSSTSSSAPEAETKFTKRDESSSLSSERNSRATELKYSPFSRVYVSSRKPNHIESPFRRYSLFYSDDYSTNYEYIMDVNNVSNLSLEKFAIGHHVILFKSDDRIETNLLKCMNTFRNTRLFTHHCSESKLAIVFQRLNAFLLNNQCIYDALLTIEIKFIYLRNWFEIAFTFKESNPLLNNYSLMISREVFGVGSLNSEEIDQSGLGATGHTKPLLFERFSPRPVKTDAGLSANCGNNSFTKP